MLLSRASRRYAKALYDLAGERGAVDRVLPDLETLERLTGESAELSGFLSDYVIDRQTRARVLETLFRERTDPLTWEFLLFLEEKKRIGLLGDACRAFILIHDAARGIRKAVLTVAYPLFPEQVAGIVERARSRTGKPVEATLETQPDLVGGFCLRVEDCVYDLSTAGALRAFKREQVGV